MAPLKTSKKQSFRRGPRTFNPNAKPWEFEGTPSPEEMHHHIIHKKATTHNSFSITTSNGVHEAWWPLDANAHMETRPCFGANSRIHLLNCGHIVAVYGNAAPCATNCKHQLVKPKSSFFKSHVPVQYAPQLVKIRESIFQGFNSFADTCTDYRMAKRNDMWAEVLENVWRDQEAKLKPCPDLVSGDFYCQRCGTEPHRPTRPAFFLRQHPYYCIVVGKDDRDGAIINQLEKGVRPYCRECSPGGLSKKKALNRTRDRKITKHRVQEKKKVLSKLNEEILREHLNILSF